MLHKHLTENYYYYVPEMKCILERGLDYEDSPTMKKASSTQLK